MILVAFRNLCQHRHLYFRWNCTNHFIIKMNINIYDTNHNDQWPFCSHDYIIFIKVWYFFLSSISSSFFTLSGLKMKQKGTSSKLSLRKNLLFNRGVNFFLFFFFFSFCLYTHHLDAERSHSNVNFISVWGKKMSPFWVERRHR